MTVISISSGLLWARPSLGGWTRLCTSRLSCQLASRSQPRCHFLPLRAVAHQKERRGNIKYVSLGTMGGCVPLCHVNTSTFAHGMEETPASWPVPRLARGRCYLLPLSDLLGPAHQLS